MGLRDTLENNPILEAGGQKAPPNSNGIISETNMKMKE